MTQQVLTILGSTGSIGESTLDVISRHPEKFRVFALAGHRQVDKLAAQCKQFRPEYAVVGDADHAAELEKKLKQEGHRYAGFIWCSSPDLMWLRPMKSAA